MTETEFLATYKNVLSPLLIRMDSLAVALFSDNGKLEFATQAMKKLLKPDLENPMQNEILNPAFTEWENFRQTNAGFHGIITIGNISEGYFSLEGTIKPVETHYLLVADANISQLFEENKQLSQLNQEVNNLQRELIKEKKKLQAALEELKNTQDLLVHSEKMNALGKLVAGVAHELNNPVSFVYGNLFSLESEMGDIIRTYRAVEQKINESDNRDLRDFVAELALKNELDYLVGDVADMVNESKNGLERVKNIVENLRKFSRLDESDVKNADLIENLETTLAILRSEIQKKEVEIVLNAPAKVFLECYPGQLNQALLNVLANAVQAVPGKGKIEISVSEDDTNVIIVVKDNGPGVPDEIKGRIFDPFFTTKDVGAGTGLGLSITHKIICDMHRGSINLIPEQLGGAVFQMILPKTRKK